MKKIVTIILIAFISTACTSKVKTLTCFEDKLENRSESAVIKSKSGEVIYEKTISTLYYDAEYYDIEAVDVFHNMFNEMYAEIEDIEGVKVNVKRDDRTIVLTLESDYEVISEGDLIKLFPSEAMKDFQLDADRRFEILQNTFEDLDGKCTIE
ncbi:MAG: hypothetical protein RR565_06530 [Erysipelothrix sp.]